MGRLIDADRLKTAIEKYKGTEDSTDDSTDVFKYCFDCGVDESLSEVESAETVEAIPVEWIGDYLAWLQNIGAFALPDANAIKSMLKKWEMEQGHSGCGPDYCNI